MHRATSAALPSVRASSKNPGSAKTSRTRTMCANARSTRAPPGIAATRARIRPSSTKHRTPIIPPNITARRSTSPCSRLSGGKGRGDITGVSMLEGIDASLIA